MSLDPFSLSTENGVSTGPHNVAFIISESIFHFVQTGYNKILAGVQEVAAAQGWRVLFHPVGDDANNPVLQSLRNAPNRSLDGCIIVGGVRRHVLDLLDEERTPTILVDLLISEENAAAVTID